ncbi:pfkB family carbohydrate kinase, partial [Rhizoctonia solani]
MPKQFVSLGLFILDEFEFLDATGEPTGKILPTQVSSIFHSKLRARETNVGRTITQVGGGGTYAAVGARIWLPASEIGQIVDRGFDFPAAVQRELDHYGPDMWHFRDQSENKTTRAVNRYTGELRDFEYLTPRIRLTPKDLAGTPLESPRQIHFVCSPTRAYQIMQDADTYGVKDWKPFVIYEPIPFRCVPEELPALRQILHRVDILSPNAEEALGLLSIDKAGAYDYSVIEYAAARLLSFGVGKDASGHVIIRCGAMGAYAAKREGGIVRGWWTPAYWGPEDKGAVVDVTGKINHFGHDGTPTGTFVPGAGNAFLGGLSAGLSLTNRDVREAILYATVSAGYTIQQLGLPRVEYKDSGTVELWNGDRPKERLAFLRYRCADLK